MSETIAFIGFGEAGQTISRGLLGEGAPAVRAYDILFDDPANGGNRLKATFNGAQKKIILGETAQDAFRVRPDCRSRSRS